MRAVLLALALTVAGCTEMTTGSTVYGVGPALGAAPSGAQQAYFTGYPERLFLAAAAVCNKPGQTVVRGGRDRVHCESLPDVESAAALILQFDGTVEDLPTFVISFAGRPTPEGYLVTADNYIRVPQRLGGAQQIRFPDPEISRDMAQILTAAGGRPL